MKKKFSATDAAIVQDAVIAWHRADREWNAMSNPLMSMLQPELWERAWRKKVQTLKEVTKELGSRLVDEMDPYEIDWSVARTVAEKVLHASGVFSTTDVGRARTHQGATVMLDYVDYVYLRSQIIEYWGKRKSRKRKGAHA